MDILPQLLANGVIAGAVYALMAIAFSLSFSTGKFFNLALGAMVPVGGYAVYALSVQNNFPLFFSVPTGLFIAGIISMFCELWVFRPLRAKRASSLALIIASLGIATAASAILAMLFSSQLQLLPRVLDQSRLIEGISVTNLQLFTIALSLAMSVVTIGIIRLTAFGRAVRAVSDDSEVASVVGINVERIHLTVAFFTGALCALAGILIGMDVGLEPTMGLFYFLSGVIGSIVGGIGTIGASVFG